MEAEQKNCPVCFGYGVRKHVRGFGRVRSSYHEARLVKCEFCGGSGRVAVKVQPEKKAG
jgi:DnaJ-class molecular chaperone